MPTLITTFPAETPTAVLAGIQIDRWSQDRLKAYVAQEDGTIHILDTSSFLARFEWQRKGPFAEIGSFKVGRNPVSMVFTRFGESGLALMANGKDGKATGVDPLNNTFYVACRGDREVDAVVTWGGQGQIYRRIRDQRMNDPVAVSVAMRGYIVSVADFHGRKVMSFRIGSLRDRYGVFYGAGADGKQPFEFTGELSFKGSPYLLNSVNVN